jgi:hypothetical protein
MGRIVDLSQWLQSRGRTHESDVPKTSMPAEGVDSPATREVARLERAVTRLHDLVNRTMETSGRVQPKVETELLAIMGELTVGLVEEATRRAERLADRLASSGRP